MRRALAVLSLVLVASCNRCASKPEPDAGSHVAMLPTPFDPVPPSIAEAMALRSSEPCQALKLLVAAHAVAADAGDVRTVAIALHRTGDVMHDCYDTEDLDLPIESSVQYQRAYSLYLLLGEERLAGLAANDLGLEEDRDVTWFTEAVKWRRRAGSTTELMRSLNNLGGALMLQNRDQEALTILNESLGIALDAGDRDAERRTRTNLAATYLSRVEEGDAGLDVMGAAHRELLAAQRLLVELGKNEDVCFGLMMHQVDACHVLLDGGQ